MSVAYGRAFGKPNKIPLAIRKWAFLSSNFKEFGLFHDDCLNQDSIVEEALRRIPEDVRNARNFRIIRATQFSSMHRILPKEQWTTFEDDQKNRYLWKAIAEIVKEMDEKAEWEKSH